MKSWVIIPVLAGVFGLLLGWALLAHWEVGPFTWEAVVYEAPELTKFALACGAVALSLAFLTYWISGKALKWISMPTAGKMLVLALACLAPGVWGGARLWKQNRGIELTRIDRKAQGELEAILEGLKKQGRYDEMVQEMERVLAIHDELVAITGPGHESCNHGYSYLFVTLIPASEDLPAFLGWGLSRCLYDAWHDLSGTQKSAADGLSKAMTRSRHPLLRAIGYWVEQDYDAFEREAMAGAERGDRRMDSLALVAACGLSKDRKAALEKIRPILDRGVGLGKNSYRSTSSDIQAYLEGTGKEPAGYFMGLRSWRK